LIKIVERYDVFYHPQTKVSVKFECVEMKVDTFLTSARGAGQQSASRSGRLANQEASVSSSQFGYRGKKKSQSLLEIKPQSSAPCQSEVCSNFMNLNIQTLHFDNIRQEYNKPHKMLTF
jgi:hypothetical protein